MKRTESPGTPQPGRLRLCYSKSVAGRALSTALIVSFVLNAINHGGAVMPGTVTGAQWIKDGSDLLRSLLRVRLFERQGDSGNANAAGRENKGPSIRRQS